MSWIFQYLKSMGDNFGFVTDNVYRSAQPTKDDLKRLKANIQLDEVLNLRANLPLKYFDEANDLGIALDNIPMFDDSPPSPKDVDQALHIIRENYISRSPILVCCKGGRHRTSLIIACYRVRYNGWTKERAWEEAKKYGWYDANGHKPLREFFFKEFDK